MTTPTQSGLPSTVSWLAFFLLLGCLAGCAGTKNSASFERLDSSASRAASLCILDDVHSLNPVMESGIAADLNAAFAGRGFRIATNPADADLVLVPTLGRVLETGTENGQRSSGARMVDRERSLIVSPSRTGMTQAQERGFSHSSRASFQTGPEWRAGLLLTAYDRAAHGVFDPDAKDLSPVWRAYASMTITKPSWREASKPLIHAVVDGVDANLR